MDDPSVHVIVRSEDNQVIAIFAAGSTGKSVLAQVVTKTGAVGTIRKMDGLDVAGDEGENLQAGEYMFTTSIAGAASESALPIYLQGNYQVNTVDEYLVQKYQTVYAKARPSTLGCRGRLPSDLRSLDKPFLRSVLGHDGAEHEIEFGRQLQLTCRGYMVRVALFFFAKIENRFLYGSGGNSGYLRSLCWMALIGSPGTGKTTALLELVHLMREHISNQYEDALDLVRHAVGPRREGSQPVEETLKRLSRSIEEGRELVAWLRLEEDIELVPHKEADLDIGTIMALRILYGCLTYMDNLDGQPSPLGSYREFLESLDDRVRVKLQLANTFAFLDAVTGVDPEAQRVVFILMDEFNAVQSPFPADALMGEDGRRRTWAKRGVSALLQFTVQQRSKKRLVLPIIGTNRHTDATLAGTSTPKAKVAPLPLNAPLLPDLQKLLRGVSQRVQLALNGRGFSSEAVENEHSAVVQLAAFVGGNFRLLAWLLALLGGAATADKDDAWTSEQLALWLYEEGGLRPRPRPRHSVASVLQELQSAMRTAGWFDTLVMLQHTAKLKILQQVVAHALTGKPVQLGACVLPDLDITWGGLLSEGLIHPVFLIEETEATLRSSVRLDESPAREPTMQASTGLGRVQVVPSTCTALGVRRVADPAANLASVEVTIEMAPAVMPGLWSRGGGLNMSPLWEAVYQEDERKKELVDVAAVLYPMFLRRKYLGESYCRFIDVVRAMWLPPWAAPLRLQLPEAQVLDRIARFDGQLTPDYYQAVRAAAHMALNYTEGDSFEAVEQAAQNACLDLPGVAVSASSNYGADTILFTKTQTGMLASTGPEFLDIIFQSKRTEGSDTQTLQDALAEEKKDLLRHNITVGEAPHVKGLLGPEAHRELKSPRLQADPGWHMHEACGGFSTGSMEEFEAAVGEASEDVLKSWEEQLLELDIQPPAPSTGFMYLFVTDHRMLPIQHAQLRVLSLAGHPYASRMVFINQAQQKSFYGMAMSIQRSLEKLQSFGQ